LSSLVYSPSILTFSSAGSVNVHSSAYLTGFNEAVLCNNYSSTYRWIVDDVCSSIKCFNTTCDIHKRLAHTTGNVKISIILALSIAILAAVLVTGTVVNIVSAAKSINVQTKTNPVTNTGNPHIAPSAAHGINVQTKTNQHPITSTGNPHIISAAHGTKCKSGPCPNGAWSSKFTAFSLSHASGEEYHVNGILVGETGSGVYYGIKDGTIEIGLSYRDGHCCLPAKFRTEIPYNYHPGVPGDGKFSDFFWTCDDPKAKDHTALVTAYFGDQRAMNLDTYFPHPGPGHGDTAYDYDGTTTLKDLGGNSRNINIDVCGQGGAQAHFTAHK
jgi:hypothetical protein